MTNEADAGPKKEDADSLVLEVLSDKAMHQYHVGRKGPLQKATEIYAGLELHELARRTNHDVNIFAYSLGNSIRSHGYDRKWGRFGPLGSGKDKDGKEFLFPDPHWIDEEMVAHALKRTTEINNPLVLAIYFDLAFEHAKIHDKRPYAISAIENYFDAAEIQFSNGWDFQCQDSLIRAWELAIKIGDKGKIDEAQKKIFLYVDKYATKENPRFTLELLEVLLSQSKQLTAKQREQLVKTAENASTKYPDNHHLEQAFLEFAQKVYRSSGDKVGELAAELRIIDSLIAEAKFKSEQALVEAHFLEKALERVLQIKDPRKEADTLRRRIEEAYERSIPDFKEFSVEIKISNDEIKEIVDHYFVGDPQETLRRVAAARSLLPDYKSSEDFAKRLMKEYPLQQIIGGSTIQGNRRINQRKGGHEVNEDHVVTQMGQNLKLTALLRTVIFRELKNRSIGVSEIIRLLKDSDFFQYDNFAAIEEALADFEDSKYFSAVSVIIPQIEELLRSVVFELGLPTTVTINGNQQAIKIGEILDKLRPALGEQVYWYLALAMYDKRGMALRDDIGHGLLKYGPQNEDEALLAVHMLLVLSSFKITIKEQGD
ncbi:MAG TPA: DUF4209 domain-containing protein [Candidatus Saccharimonadales bacterium]|nr:DUF4209 domain-containing protein [Candidatus Saccharimonadales bacterium]